MHKPKVIFRADGNEQLGLGHLYRCLSLAQMLKDDFQIHFVFKDAPGDFIRNLDAFRFTYLKMVNEDDWLSNLPPFQAVVIDGYHFDFGLQKKIKDKGAYLVCIDDFFSNFYKPDLIINHAPGVEINNYSVNSFTRYALGLQYALLRPEFLCTASNRYSLEKEPNSLFICFGGADPQNLTFKTLMLALELKSYRKIVLVTGTAYKHQESISKLVRQYKEVLHFESIDEYEMADLLRKSETAVVPASGILFEALACRCNVISGYYTDNQKVIYHGFLKQNAIIDAKCFSTESLFSSFQSSLIKSKSVGNKMIDGKSDNRYRKLFKDLFQ